MFDNRQQAALLLAKKLLLYKNKKEAVVVAIPRGGVEIGYYVVQQLHLPLDIVIVKKIGYPGNEELALGAASTEGYYVDEDLAYIQEIPTQYIIEEGRRKQKEAIERYTFLQGSKKNGSLKKKTVILVDDGVATGATMMLALEVLQKQHPEKVIIAVPVIAQSAVRKLERIADEVIYIEKPEEFFALSRFYRNFEPVTDAQAKKFLEKAREK